MDTVEQFINSGILESYILGLSSAEETTEVLTMMAAHIEVREAVTSLELMLESYAQQQAQVVDPVVKSFLMAKINYMERLGGGEPPAAPPQLHIGSKLADYDEWLNRTDLMPEPDCDDMEARIISATESMLTAIVWLKKGSPPEMHTDELESFLIVEGTCNIVVDGTDNHLKPGDYFAIPLHVWHEVIVTSEETCRVILQRAAA